MRKGIAIGAILATIAVALVGGYYVFWISNVAGSNTARINFAGVTLIVDLATTPAEQQQGLSGRDSLPADHGMLFIFQQAGQWGFWMPKMKFPLDIIWFDSNKRVVFIEQDLAPCTPTVCPVYTPPTAALYVLEVNAGFVKAHDVVVGDSFTFT
jgi:uncharacterized membrane protein (UPF0127 family)